MKIVLFGPPGVGKGTQAKLLEKEFNIPHISTGQIFRDHIKNRTELGLQIIDIMNSGNFVSDELTCKIVDTNISKSINYILDGFPRTEYQGEWFKERYNANHYFLLDATTQTCRDRIKKRGKIENRPEDLDDKVIEERFNIYRNTTLPCIYNFKDIIHIIKCEYPIKDVYKNIKEYINV